MRYLLIALFFCSLYFSNSYALQSASYSGNTAPTYQLIADFESTKLKYRNIQVLNPDGFPIECANDDAVDATKVILIPNKFTSVTLENIYPTGKLYCRCTLGTGPHTITVHTWGLQ